MALPLARRKLIGPPVRPRPQAGHIVDGMADRGHADILRERIDGATDL